MTVLTIVIAIIASYLLGALSGSLILAPIFGKDDPRTSGSGNAGATNALRSGGRGYGVAVLVFDLVKGVIAALVIPWLLAIPPGWAFACGAVAVIGHVYPVYFGFRGGKGAATVIGVLLALLPAALGVGVVIWVVTLVISGYVGLATLLGMVAVALWCIITHAAADAASAFVVVMTVLVFYTHRGNIARMRQGTENRFTGIMLRKPRKHP